MCFSKVPFLFQYRLQIASVETSNTLCLILGVCCRHHKSASKSRLRSQAFSRSSQGRLRRASSAGNSKLAYSQVRTPVRRTIFFSGSRFCEQKKTAIAWTCYNGSCPIWDISSETIVKKKPDSSQASSVFQ